MTRSSDAAPDPAASDTVDITFVGHATVLLDLGGIRLLTDPFLRPRLGPLQRHGAAPDPASLRADVVVISHGHPDHFDRRSLEELPGRPVLVVPRGLGPGARSIRGTGGVVEIAAGESIDVGGFAIRAVPARHWISPGSPRAMPIGYVLDGSGTRAYFAGDTGRYPTLERTVGPVDVALLPVWTWGPHLGPGHLGPRTAAAVAAELAPRVVIPIHWGTLYPRHLHRVWRRPLHSPGDRFATHVRDMAPGVAVHVLAPGEAVSLPARPRA